MQQGRSLLSKPGNATSLNQEIQDIMLLISAIASLP
jgi:hypothetical protein